MLVLILFLFLLGCEKQDNRNNDTNPQSNTGNFQPTEEQMEDQPIKIGFAMDTLTEERWLKDRDFFKKSVEDLGAEVEVMASHGDDALQIWQAETMISKGIDLLVIVPHNAESTAAIVEKAHSAGIKVLSYDRLVKNAEVDMYLSYDNEQVGTLQAQAILGIVPKGKYVYIGGAETDNNAHMAKKGVFDVLQSHIEKGDITIVFDQWTKDWEPANAKDNIELALDANNNNIDAVIAANDATAGAVIEVLESRGLAGKIPVAGQDADLAAIQRIVDGTQAMTIYKPIKELTDLAAELAIKLAKDEEIGDVVKVNNGKMEVPSILLSPTIVNQTNIDDTIIADGFHTREEVYLKNNKSD
ncbi:substrate-binding domain-containing protein [Metabacillus litoralis]|uniref:Substrate-binding domain-containing protein n=1 Tax=Metabacillus litoralis TaxID=152268 RepID=A0A5C6W0X7_9BACI|nr:substrate-binding domain-containing protein [Metabacillus litoralis]TXC90639.1 substrate-binding domain-containing protein [Metabacillus litoralis]